MNKLGSLLTTTARYVETHESGSFQDTITGSVRERVVSKALRAYAAMATSADKGAVRQVD